MKKLFAFLLACMMLLPTVAAFAEDGEGTDSTTPSTSVYTPVTPPNDMLSQTHTLTLSDTNATQLPYKITYSFSVSEKATIMQPTDIILANAHMAVTGAPSIAQIIYTPEDTFDENKSCTKNLVIDWSNVKIKEPGVYRWEVTKSFEDEDAANDPTNNTTTSYLWVYAKDNGSGLAIASVGYTTDANLQEEEGEDEKGPMGDTYPAKTINLTISKAVTGDQGSRDQYFKFTIQLKRPVGAIDKECDITGSFDETVRATAYNNATTNQNKITVEENTTLVLWLKHGQNAIINDLLFGTSYVITESENIGYNVGTVVTGDTNGVTKAVDNKEVRDTSLEEATTVAYTNEKKATVPTGIDLQTGAPIMGLLMAASMLLMLFIGKRKEAAE